MEKIKKQITIFTAKDGKEFLTEEECVKYEKEVLDLLSKIKYFSCVHSPDLTEGRGYFGCTKFAVYDPTYCFRNRVLEYCIKTFGNPLEYVQGHSAIENYTFPQEITKEQYQNDAGTSVGSYNYKSKKVLISPRKIEGFPEPFWTK